MTRCVIMVDAGYLYAAGGQLRCGTRSRAEIILDPEPVLQAIRSLARSTLDAPVLRTYWYDAARDGIRTAEQRAIAALNDVKLRLGRLNGQNQQKGVDALIYRDMITLAQHGAVSDVVLLSGDEDLHEGVRTVQDYGVRVTLVGIKAVNGHNQSEELVYEADRLWMLDEQVLATAFTRRAPQAGPRLGVDEAKALASEAKQAAVEFAAQWRDHTGDVELLELLAERPRIPRPLDIELITAVERAIGRTLQDQKDLKKDIRATWWGVIGGGKPHPIPPAKSASAT
ncbi:MAG TPA: NYN domain-containing protein [Umezawaea sp.]|nr:NYN domain-containing protein [Umezawaea sp.]